MADPAALEVCGLHKRYGTLHALRGVDLTVGRGEFFGLLGPNGAGKSTLIGIAAGLVRASEGRVTVLGHDVVDRWRQARQALGVVPQELISDPFFNVRELLRLQSGYFGLHRNDDWIDELLENLGLTDKATTNMHRLSGGMKRRLLVAQALVHRPQVVILDEPTAGVDVELRQTLWRFIRRLHRDGHSIVLTTHYLEEAETLCERIAILNHGQVTACDSTAELLARHPWRLLELTLTEAVAPGALPPALERLVAERLGPRLTLRLHRLDDQIGAVLQQLHAAGCEVVDLRTAEPRLEEVFLSLTGSNGGES